MGIRALSIQQMARFRARETSSHSQCSQSHVNGYHEGVVSLTVKGRRGHGVRKIRSGRADLPGRAVEHAIFKRHRGEPRVTTERLREG